MLYFLIFTTITNSFINNIYYDKFKVPFVGSQSIKAEIQTQNSALITLQGIINEKGNVKFYENEENNNRNIDYFQKIESLKHFENNNNNINNNYDISKITFDDKLKKIIKKYNIEFKSPNYDEENDIISFTINVKKVFYKRIIKMKRIN